MVTIKIIFRFDLLKAHLITFYKREQIMPAPFVGLRHEASLQRYSNNSFKKFNSRLIVFIKVIFLSLVQPFIYYFLNMANCIHVNFSKYNK